jgi:Domain of unknown function (DUF4314)
MNGFPGIAEGDRVRLVACTDEYTRLEPGALGTVALIDGLGTVHVDWDSGARLGMVAEAGDRIVKVGAVVKLSEREAAALSALADAPNSVNGDGLARRMRAGGRVTSTAAAHQAGAALARKGLAVKAQDTFTLIVMYEIAEAGRDLVRLGLRPPGTQVTE